MTYLTILKHIISCKRYYNMYKYILFQSGFYVNNPKIFMNNVLKNNHGIIWGRLSHAEYCTTGIHQQIRLYYYTKGDNTLVKKVILIYNKYLILKYINNEIWLIEKI